MKKHSEFFEKHRIGSRSFLFNNAYEAENIIIAGTRGWYHDEDATNAPDNADFQKLTAREELRLRASLKEAVNLRADGGKEIVIFTHFPPFWNGKASDNIIAVLKEYEIKRLYYGHIHGNYTVPPSFEYEGIEMNIISADYLGFTPKFISK